MTNIRSVHQNTSSRFKILPIVIIAVIICASFSNPVFAVKEKNTTSKFITNGDMYIQSKTPAHVWFNVKAIDEPNVNLSVNCDKISGQMFPIGKTTVRCEARDRAGNQITTSFTVTVGFTIVHIPEWVKNTASYWTSGKISDTEYTNALNYLLENKSMMMPQSKKTIAEQNIIMPVWIKKNSEKWANGQLSNDEFSIGIQWMLEHGILRQT